MARANNNIKFVVSPKIDLGSRKSIVDSKKWALNTWITKILTS